MDLLQHRATLFLNRTPYGELVRLVKANHPDDWQTSSYGKAVASLCAPATTNHLLVFAGAVGSLVQALLAEDLHAPSLDRVRSGLSSIGEALLMPENMTACFGPPPDRSNEPFGPFMSFLDHLSQAQAGDRGRWSAHIRPLLQHLLSTTEAHVVEKKTPSRNPDALYAIPVYRLKVPSPEHLERLRN